MSWSVFIIGASGYIGLGVALAFRRAGYHVYGLIRNEKHLNTLLQNEIVPIGAQTFDNIQPFADQLASCPIIIDTVGYTPKLSPNLLEAAVKIVMTYGDTSPTDRRPVDEMIKPRSQPASQRDSGASSADVTAMKDREDFENQVLATSSAALKTTVVRPGFVYGV